MKLYSDENAVQYPNFYFPISGHNSKKQLVKTSETLAAIDFEESLVKSISLNFFCT